MSPSKKTLTVNRKLFERMLEQLKEWNDSIVAGGNAEWRLGQLIEQAEDVLEKAAK